MEELMRILSPLAEKFDVQVKQGGACVTVGQIITVALQPRGYKIDAPFMEDSVIAATPVGAATEAVCLAVTARVRRAAFDVVWQELEAQS